MQIDIDMRQVQALESALRGVKSNLGTHVRVAVNNTVKGTKVQMAKDIGKQINMKASELKSSKVMQTKFATSKAMPFGNVTLFHEKRYSMFKKGSRNRFAPNHNKAKRSGVSYKVNRSGGRKILKGAFMGPKPGILFKKPQIAGMVFIRKGKARMPITVIHGISPWGTFQKNEMSPEIKKYAEQRLSKELDRRLSYITRRLR